MADLAEDFLEAVLLDADLLPAEEDEDFLRPEDALLPDLLLDCVADVPEDFFAAMVSSQ